MKYAPNFATAFTIALSIPIFADNEINSCVWETYTADAFSDCQAFATQNIASAQYTVGKAYLLGVGTEKNQFDGEFWISESAKNGFAPAQYDLGYLFETRFNVKEEADLKKAYEWYSKAAAQGDLDAKYALALLLLTGKGGIAKNIDDGIQQLSSAALNGNTEASMYLADLYKAGVHKPKDKEESLKWRKQAAKDGHIEAQMELGSLYLEGDGTIAKDPKEALKWFLNPAEQNIVEAQILVANLLAFDKKYSEALNWFLKIAEARSGNHICMFYSQPEQYLKSNQIDQAEKAKKWCLTEAEHGNANAQFALAILYYAGKDGFSKDNILAYKWALLGEINKNEISKELLKKWTLTDISEENRKKAKELIKEWQKKKKQESITKIN